MSSSPSTPSPSRLVPLATRILNHATNIEHHLHQQGIDSPSLLPSGGNASLLDPALQADVSHALEALDELNALLLGPVGLLVAQMHSAIGMASLHTLYRCKVPSLLHPGEEITPQDLALRCGQGTDTDALVRLIQHAATTRILSRPRPGFVAHSASSDAMAHNPGLMAWVGSFSEDIWPAAPRMLDAQAKCSSSIQDKTPPVTAHNLAEGTNVPFFETLEGDPARARRFASAMTFMQDSPGWGPAAALDAFDWGSLRPGSEGRAKVVDVGGGDGAFTAALVEQNPFLDVIVQDLPSVVMQKDTVSKDLDGSGNERVTFQVHDFFTEQPIHGADAYVLRMVLHDWPDEKAVQILRQLIPALKPGARVIINDHCMSSLPGKLLQERHARCTDLIMMGVFGGKERSEEEWRSLVGRADGRFRLASVVCMTTGPLAMLEVVWDPCDESA